MKMRKMLSLALCMVLAFSLTGCASGSANAGTSGFPAQSAVPKETDALTDTASSQAMRPSFAAAADLMAAMEVTPSVKTADTDYRWQDAVNADRFYEREEVRQALNQYHFAIGQGMGYEFYEIYESNKYDYMSSFVTVDSILHTYHLYYAYLQKNLEKTALLETLKKMSNTLLAESQTCYKALQGTAFETAAARNVDYFSVAAHLLGIDAALSETAAKEVSLIEAASGIEVSPIFSAERTYNQDYSQFQPRSYYADDPELEQYFRAMMWYGQMNFSQQEEDLDRSALLAAYAIKKTALSDWEKIYLVTSFLAGESDDSGYYEYAPILEKVYGNDLTIETIGNDAAKFEEFHKLTGQLEPPKLNSMAVYDWEDRDAVTPGFRVMGQRFSVDASILQRLVYREVGENADGDRRMMPDALDVPAALGSQEALTILKDTTNVSTFPDYEKNMNELRQVIEAADETMFTGSVAAAWLNTLRPLLNEDRTGYPDFMQSKMWARKNLNSFLGSYTELKHDTVLYQKQILSEMGADGIAPVDDRGYVEPEPEVYGRLAALSETTVKGLQKYDLISDEDREYMDILTDLCKKLKTISEKELKEELPSEEEFDLIRNYGGTLQHLWLRTVKTPGHSDYYKSQEFPASLVTDIATDPDSETCLEIADGNPAEIAVLVWFDNALHICTGSVYTFTSFPQPVSDRLTDEAWREICNYPYNPAYPLIPEWAVPYSQGLAISLQKAVGYLRDDAETAVIRDAPSENGKTIAPEKRESSYTVYEIQNTDTGTWYRVGIDRWIGEKENDGLIYRD